MNRALTLTCVLLASSTVWAAPFAVNNAADAVDAAPGDGTCATATAVCTLRAAIQEANAFPGADTISLPAGNYLLTIAGAGENAAASGDLDVTQNVTISGAGAGTTVVDANGIDRAFEVDPLQVGVIAAISDLTVRGGVASGAPGGGLRNWSTLTLTDVTVTANTAPEGGGIFSQGVPSRLTLTRVDLLANTSPGGKGGGVMTKDATTSFDFTDVTISGSNAKTGGGIYNDKGVGTLTRVTVSGNSAEDGAGIFTTGSGLTMTMENVTISGNTASKTGGGVRSEAGNSVLTNVTLSGNSATTSGGGLIRTGGTIQLKNTIVVNSPSGGDCVGTITSLGYNIDGDGSCSLSGPGDQPSADPKLTPLQSNGGPTLTHALLSGSAAVDTGTNTGCPATDQRSIARPRDGDGDTVATCEIGAVESIIRIAGAVFEDIVGDELLDGVVTDVNNPGVPGADVRLYLDNGDTLPGAGDVLTAGPVPTGSNGNFAFVTLPDGAYWVVVDSKTVRSTVDPAEPLTSLWAEQTYAPAGARCADGTGGTLTRAGPGPCYGGRRAGVSDDATLLTNAEHLALVPLPPAEVTGVFVGFSFNAVTHPGDGDDDAAPARTSQGALRQFLQNANAVDGSNVMRSVPATAPNTTVGGNSWWTVTPGSLFPVISGSGTEVDGTSYCAWDVGPAPCTGTATTRTTNPGLLGSGGTVGLGADALPGTGDEPLLPQVAAPEIEIRDTSGLLYGLQIQANDATLRGVAMLGFGTGPAGEGAIHLSNNVTGALIEDNVLGTTADSFMNPGATLRNYETIYSDGADSGTIRNNLIGFGNIRGIFLLNNSTGWTVSGNEIKDNAQTDAGGDGLALDDASGSFTGNRISGSSSQGIVVTNSTASTFTDNTLTGNGVGLTSASGAAAGITFRSSASSMTVERNLITANYAAGLSVNNGATGVKITKNSFADNGTIVARNGDPQTDQIGIDLNNPTDDSNKGTPPYVSLNDPTDSLPGGNNLRNYPVLDTAAISGPNLELTGWARPGAVIEVFIAAADLSSFGEGQAYKLTLTEGGTGSGGDDPYADLDALPDSYGPGAVNGILQGDDTAERFRFVFPVPLGVVNGTQLTATGRDGAGNTSEFSGLVTVTQTFIVSGLVFEDVAGDVLTGGQTAGDASNPGRGNVDVYLYDDLGATTGQPDATDNLVAGPIQTATSGTVGAYSFSGLAGGTYWVVVDSKTVGPSAGIQAPYAATHAWSEQSFGSTGAWCEDGTGSTVERVSDGPCYAGRRVGTSDDASALLTSEHVTRVVVSSADVTDVDFGFSFSVVTNTSPGVQAVNDVRSTQGSFDQALANANAIVSGNSLRFVPALAPDDGSGNWWRIDYTGATAALESIYDTATVVDGTAYCAWDDGTQGCSAVTQVRDTNTAGIGANQTVGVTGSFTTPSLDPELEIVDEGLRISQTQAPLVPNGFELRHLSIRGDTVAIDFETGAASPTGLVIENNVIGSGPAAFSEPATLPQDVVRISAATGGQIRDNLIGFAQRSSLLLSTTSSGSIVTRNEIREGGKVFNAYDTVLIWASPSTVEGNLIADGEAVGIDTIPSGGGHTIRENTITGHGLGGAQTAGVRLVGTANTVELNVIQSNAGPGILVSGGATASTQNRISENEFGSNGGTAIDLVATGGDNNVGDGVTLNDGTQLGDATAGNGCGIVATSGNEGLDFPIIDSVMLTGDVTGRACPGAEVELYLATAGVGDSSGGTDYGEGVTHLVTTTADGTGNFSVNVGALSPGTELTATAIDTSNNTSEFAANVVADPLTIVKRAFRLDGTPIASGSTLPQGMPVRFLLYVNNRGALTSDASVQEVLDPLFVYTPGSARFDATTPSCVAAVCTAAEEATIFAAAVTGTVGTDTIDPDIMSYAGTTLDIGDQNAGNARLDLPATRVFAIVFTVTMQ